MLVLTLYGALIVFLVCVLLPVALLFRVPLRDFFRAVKVPANWRPPLADDQKRHQLEDPVMRKFVARASVVAFSALLAFASAAQAQTKSLTLCWAAWDPANALVELSKDFTTKTGIQMKFEFVPWPNFADRMLN